MRKRNGKFRVLTVAVLIIALLICSCNSKGSDNESTSETKETENTTEPETEEVDRLLDYKTDYDNFYDISKAVMNVSNDLIDSTDEFSRAYAIDDKGMNLELIYGHWEDDKIVSYRFIGYNYHTGEFKKLRKDLEVNDSYVDLNLVSYEKDTYYDASDSVLFVGDKAINLSEYGYVNVFEMHGEVFVFAGDKGKFYILKDNCQFEETVSIPDYLDATYIVSSFRQDYVIVSAHFGREQIYVNLDVDPQKGILNLYKSSYYDETFKEYESGKFYEWNFRPEDNSDENKEDGICLYMDDKIYFKKMDYYPNEIGFYEMDVFSYTNDGFFILNEYDNFGCASGLVLWDSNGLVGCEEYDWIKCDKTPYEIKTYSYDELTDKAEELGDKYGVKFIIGENVNKEYSEYKVEYCTDNEDIIYALDLFDEVFSMFPEGYISKLKYDAIDSINIYLTGDISQVDEYAGISSPAAFVSESFGHENCIFDISNQLITKGTICHEFTHVLDNKLYYDGVLDDEQWNQLNPKGFEYYNEYQDGNGNETDLSDDGSYTYISAYFFEDGEIEDVYFFDSYAKTFATEDRARLMENLLEDGYEDSNFFDSQHVKDKLLWYFDIIEKDLGISESENPVWRQHLSKFK